MECCVCKLEKGLEEFSHLERGKESSQRTCNRCNQKLRNGRTIHCSTCKKDLNWRRFSKKQRYSYISSPQCHRCTQFNGPTKKMCGECEIMKSIEQFPKVERGRKDGLCGPCFNRQMSGIRNNHFRSCRDLGFEKPVRATINEGIHEQIIFQGSQISQVPSNLSFC